MDNGIRCAINLFIVGNYWTISTPPAFFGITVHCCGTTACGMNAPTPLTLGDANDLGGGECVEAVHEGDTDVDFCGLAVWRSGSRAVMRSPEDLRPRIFASMRLWEWYLVHRFFRKARP